MDLLQDQDCRKSPSDYSTESFEQLESLISQENDLSATSANLSDSEPPPAASTTAANQNLNLDLLTEETGEGLPLNMQLSMTASDHSTPEAASKPNLVEVVPETPSKTVTESASNEPGLGDAVVHTSSPSLPQGVEVDDNFSQFESRYCGSKKAELLEEEEEKIIEQDEPELVERDMFEHEILVKEIIKEEKLPEVPSPLTQSFIEEEERVVVSQPTVPKVLQARIEEGVKKEIADVQSVVLQEVSDDRKTVEEPVAKSLQKESVVEPPLPSAPIVPDLLLLSSLPGKGVEEEEEVHHPVEPDLRTHQPPPSFLTSKSPSLFSSSASTSGQVARPQVPPPNPPQVSTVKTPVPTKVTMGETVPEECPFKSIGSYFVRGNLDPRLADLVYWKDPKRSGIAFGIGLVILLSLACCSVISVISYTALTVLTGSLGFRIYKSIMQAVQKTNDGHPFKEYLELEVTLPNERVHQIVDIAVKHVNATILKLRSVFLAEDIIDSIKFVVFFWCLTYIGSWFNGLTLIILAYLGAFSLPKVYEMHQAQIDQALGMVWSQVSDAVNLVKSKIPFPAAKDKKQ